MNQPKHFHLLLPGDLAAAIDERRKAIPVFEGERMSMTAMLRRLIRAGLAAEGPNHSGMVTSGR